MAGEVEGAKNSTQLCLIWATASFVVEDSVLIWELPALLPPQALIAALMTAIATHPATRTAITKDVPTGSGPPTPV